MYERKTTYGTERKTVEQRSCVIDEKIGMALEERIIK